MSKTQPSLRTRLARTGIATAAVAAAILATASPAQAANAPLTLSTAAGSTAGGNTITATSTALANFLSGVTAPVATFSIPACQTTYNSTASTAVPPTSTTAGNVLVPALDTNKISNTKASIKVPALALAPNTATSTKYNLCVYSSSTAASPIVGSASYTVATAATVTTVAPTSGSALGGSSITVTGTNFPTVASQISATLGGVPLTGIVANSATSFTANTPAHAPGVVPLVVTTAAGPVTKASAYTYSNGISITPNTSPSTATALYVDVLGAGFTGYDFAPGATVPAAVYLVDGKYDPDAAAATAYINGPTAKCASVVVISDNELICVLNLFTGALDPTSALAATDTKVPDGTYTMTVVNNGNAGVSDAVGYAASDISSSSTFTVAAY
jgi:hypothetical protein